MKMKRVISLLLAFAMVMTMCAIPSGTVQAATTAKKITLNKKVVSLNEGKTTKLKVKVTPATAKKTITWKTSNKQIAKVNKKGVVTGVKAGKATITVRVRSGKKLLKAKCKVTVKAATIVTPSEVKVSAVTGDKASTTLDEADIEQFNVSVRPANAANKTLKFYSMDENVATVSNTGVITAVAQGTTTITAVSTDGTNKSVSIKVTVTKKDRPRTIITQDAEVDDKNSLVHALLYANEIDIQGIIQTSSRWHWEGVEGKVNDGNALNTRGDFSKNMRWPGTQWMYDYLDDYAKVYPNLKKQDSSYPTPDYLRSVTKIGNIGYEGEMDNATDGSELVRKAILDDDDRTLYLMAWGGTNTIARALSDIEAEYKNTAKWNTLREKIENKVVIAAFAQQDKTYINYIAEVYPYIQYIDVAETKYGYGWDSVLTGETKESFSAPFMRKYLDYNRGALMDNYVTWGDGTYLEGEGAGSQFGLDSKLGTTGWYGGPYNRYDFISEGDSPSFFILLDTGLRNLEDESYGGYHGRYAMDTTLKNSKNQQLNYWIEQDDTSMTMSGTDTAEKSDLKWLLDVQHEFATRASWCVTDSYAKANHEPAISVDKGTDIKAMPGQSVRLQATTSDPDGDYVKVKWSEYKDAGTYTGDAIPLKGENSDIVTFTVPADANKGDTIHIIAKASDDVTNSLSHYQRVIVTVK